MMCPMKVLTWITVAWGWLILLLWTMGVVFERGEGALAWVAWIPVTFWFFAAIPGLIVLEALASLAQPRVRGVLPIAVIPVLVLFAGSLRDDWRLPGALPERSGDDVTVAFVNASYPAQRIERTAARKILDLDTDLVLITDAAGLFGAIKDQLARLEDPPRLAGTFKVSVLSKLPISRLEMELATEDMTAVLVTVELKNGRPFSILVVDLSSNPRQSRMEVARALRAYLDAPGGNAIDMVVGDFNMTPRSSALVVAGGDLQDAFAVAGSGWGGTWPGGRPVLRLDHALVSPHVTVRDARTFSIGGAHRGLLLNLVPRDPGIPETAQADRGD